MVTPDPSIEERALARYADERLHTDDGCVVAIRCDSLTRGKARAFFASEAGIGFTEVRMSKTAYRFDADWEREQRENGIEEPYDGWPMFECRSTDEGAVAYWKDEETDAF